MSTLNKIYMSSIKDFSTIFTELNLKVKNYVCKFCINKINRFVRIYSKTILAKLYEKRNELFSEIKITVISFKSTLTYTCK